MLRRLEADIFPKLGNRPIRDIAAPELLSVIKLIEKRGALEVAQRALKVCGQIFMFGIATGRADRNPAADLHGALKTAKKENFPHLQDNELPEFLQTLEDYQGMRQNQLATKLLALTFVRTVELRGARWSEIDFAKAEWRIPAERMKKRRPHIVPLSKQALLILKELKLMNGSWEFVFPNPYRPIKCMSENGVLSVIYRMGYKGKVTGHGFRHTASTILNENGFNRDHIERQLAHVEDNKVRGVYNHAEYLPDRRKMMQWWGDYLDAKRVLSFLSPLSTSYPQIGRWFNTKVVPGVWNGTRHIVRIERDGQLIAVGIAKKEGNEHKICTIRVAPAYEGKGFGIRVLNSLMEWLDTNLPLATVSEENMPCFERIFARYGFMLTSVENGLYRPGKLEFVFNHPLSPMMR